MTLRVFCSVLTVLATTILSAQERATPFDPDSAAANLRVLSVDIGPRPMGSPGEQAAFQYGLQRFREAGLDEVYLLPFFVAPAQRGVGTNTNSGTAVGILRGRSNRIIIIGGHIDSYAPEGPGANDDGSGSAIVMELARVMAQREWESTLVFCLFGGEESGLKGSFDFVKQFSEIDSVALMLQVDMANGAEWLIPMYDLRSTSAPEWLVSASYEEFDKLGYSGLYYPTHFYTVNSAMSGASSDHEPFLRKGIPAIDFTSDVSDPIHTPQDSYDNFQFGSLQRSGNLIYKLTERFDGGVPDEKEGTYMTVQIGSKPYLIPFWLLWILIIGSVASGVWSLITLRKMRTERRGETWHRIPGLKVVGATLAVSLGAVFVEDVISFLSGYRAPWFWEPTTMIPVSILTGVLILLGLSRLANRAGMSNDEYRYGLRSGITLLVYIILGALVSPRMAIYPAVGLFFTSLAYVSGRGVLSIALVILGAYTSVRLLLSEVFDFMARSFALVPAGGSALAVSFILSLLLLIVLAPFMLALVGVSRSTGKSWPSIRLDYWHPAWAGILAAAVILFSSFVLMEPPYSRVWAQRIDVTQEVGIDGNLRTTVMSPDYLDGAHISFVALDTTVTSNETTVILPELPFNQNTWLHSDISGLDSDRGAFVLSIHSWARPYKLEVRYSTSQYGEGMGVTGASAGRASVGLQDGIATIEYYSFPDTNIVLPITLTLAKPDTVKQTIVATYVEPAVPVTVTKEPSYIIRRTIVRETRSVYIGTTESNEEGEPAEN